MNLWWHELVKRLFGNKKYGYEIQFSPSGQRYKRIK